MPACAWVESRNAGLGAGAKDGQILWQLGQALYSLAHRRAFKPTASNILYHLIILSLPQDGVCQMVLCKDCFF